MNFHNTAGMYDAIAKWVEECDVEIDWEAIMQCKWWVGPKDWVPPPKWSMPTPFPSRLTPPIATKLLFAQWWNGLHIRPELGDPLDDYLQPRINEHQNVVPRNQRKKGGEGVDLRVAGDAATGRGSWKIFLKQIAAMDKIEIIELKLIKPEERKALVRMAWLEEEIRKREVEHNRERVRRQMRGEADSYMSRKSVPKLVERAKCGNIEAIIELERRGWDGAETGRMMEAAKRKSGRMREVALERWASGGRIGKRVKGGEMAKKEVKVVPERVKVGEAGEVSTVPAEEVRRGIELELEVIRVGPNPRILTCRYLELASERVCKVGVKSVANFVRGMKFKMVEPASEIEYGGVWRYEGALPRLKGRW